ncbi:MAG: transglycosylase domain-containing protein [Candidatus Paceibacterota bacterium]|jgi:penicillin-binding protein 1C
MQHHKRRRVIIYIKRLVLLCLALFFIVFGVGIIWFANLQLPDFKSFDSRKVVQSTKIFDRTGTVVLYDVHNQIRRTVVPFSSVSLNIKNATLAIEDDSFYTHAGIRPLSILRSVYKDIVSGSAKQGGSTITQQVIKNTLLTSDKNITRKIKEIVLALKMEQVMSKDDIFGLYLNEVPYGGTVYGVEEASLGFFGKHASDVDLAEAAYLASLPQAPTYYSPLGNNRSALDSRKNFVLDRMLALHYITKDEHSAAKAENVTFRPISDGTIKAPHFVMYVKLQLEAKYGKDLVENGGLRVTTTLDWTMQQNAEQVIKDRSPEILQKFNAQNIGTVGVDPKTGQVLLMVGSRDYFNTADEGNFNTTIAHRQPGSSFKPFVYATAFNKGYTPETEVFNVETQFSTACDSLGKPVGNSKPSDCYMPGNYDKKYDGPMSFRSALAESVNVVAVKALYLAGITDSITTATNMGIKGLADKERYGLTLVLGGGEVSLLDLVESYGGFANDGVRYPETTILKVEDSKGNVIDEWRPDSSRVLPENTARLINDVLSDNAARAPAFGTNSALYIPSRPVAVKTGTTNDYRDVWITGYTPNFALGFWAGNNDNTPLEKKVAGFIIAPIWNDLMNKILPGLPVEKFIQPEPTPQDIKPVLRGMWQGNKEYIIDRTTGLLATGATPESQRIHKVVTDAHDILHWVNKDDPRGSVPSNPASDPQYNLWEIPAQKWLAENGVVNQTDAIIPTAYDNIHTTNAAPTVSISSPAPTINYPKESAVTVSFIARSQYPINQAAFFLGDIYLGLSDSAPFNFKFTPNSLGPNFTPGVYQLKVVAYDTVQNKGEATVSINIQ